MPGKIKRSREVGSGLQGWVHRMRNSADFISETLDRPLEVVYRDEHLIAVFKPAGLMVHRGEISSGEEPALLQALRDQVGQFLYPIHRIDRPTAGLVLMATSSSVAAGLGELFMSHRVLKHYQALVRGWMPDL